MPAKTGAAWVAGSHPLCGSLNAMKRVCLCITGRVQGVGYRYSAAEVADRLELLGWVRNATDGSVELVAEGPEQVLRQLIVWCRVGPRGAVVSEVSEHWQAATGALSGFEIRP